MCACVCARHNRHSNDATNSALPLLLLLLLPFLMLRQNKNIITYNLCYDLVNVMRFFVLTTFNVNRVVFGVFCVCVSLFRIAYV